MRRPRLLAAAFSLATMGTLLVPTPPTRAADEPSWTDAQRRHWSFVPPKRPDLPAVKERAWIKNPIDAFILSALEDVGLHPAAEADKVTLIRRITFDLHGLPPTAEEVDAFLADTRADAYDRLVDRLLKSPRYGERWARVWLDLARFAESDGFKADVTRPSAWRYRDWVIQALNTDLPYDRFVTHQLAGDEVVPGDDQAFLATGFNRNFPFEDNNKVPGLNRQLMLDDVTDTTASVFLGLTLGCARCHDHKYDALSQKDYYRFQALFAATAPKDDAPIASLWEQATTNSIAAEHKARRDVVKTQMGRLERPYLASLLSDRLAKLPADVRKALLTDPEERSAFQEDLLKTYAKQTTVEPKAMSAAMSPPDRRIWTSLATEMKTLERETPPPVPVASGMTDEGPEAPPVHLLFKGNFALPTEEVGPGFPSVFAASYTPRPTETTFWPTAYARSVAHPSRPSVDRPRTRQSLVAEPLRSRDRRHPQRLRHAGRRADAPGIARLAGRRTRRARLEHEGDAPLDGDERDLPSIQHARRPDACR